MTYNEKAGFSFKNLKLIFTKDFGYFEVEVKKILTSILPVYSVYTYEYVTLHTTILV